MSAGGAKFLELLFVLALVLGWGGYELWSLRRDRARDAGQRPNPQPNPHPTTDADGAGDHERRRAGERDGPRAR